MEKFINIINNQFLKILVVFIVLDVLLGLFRAIKEHKTNSTIGIDGIIRKVCMIITIIVCLVLDNLISLDLVGFIPKDIKDIFNINKIGISELFSVLYMLFESLSILKNMYKCKLPIPKKLKTFLEKLLKEFTSELKDNEKGE